MVLQDGGVKTTRLIDDWRYSIITTAGCCFKQNPSVLNCIHTLNCVGKRSYASACLYMEWVVVSAE